MVNHYQNSNYLFVILFIIGIAIVFLIASGSVEKTGLGFSSQYAECAEAECCVCCCRDKLIDCLNDCYDPGLREECEEALNECADQCDQNYEFGSPEYDRCIFDCLEQEQECLEPEQQCRHDCARDAEENCFIAICGAGPVDEGSPATPTIL